MKAALQQGEQWFTNCITILPGWNTGSSERTGKPSVVQLTWRWAGEVGTSPFSSRMRSVSTR
jgi:hypothetical protein